MRKQINIIGWRAWLWMILILTLISVIVFLAFGFILIIIPIVFAIGAVGWLLSWPKKKKVKKDYIDIEYKEK